MNRDSVYLKHIIVEADDIMSFTADGENWFMQDRKTQKAIIRSIEIIGEAVKNISDETKSKYPEIVWRQIAGMRDKLIHAYFDVSLLRVWAVATSDIPQLRIDIQYILEKFSA